MTDPCTLMTICFVTVVVCVTVDSICIGWLNYRLRKDRAKKEDTQ